jgi:hypothetical protein
VAVVLTLLAVAAGLWRGLRRFGPRLAPAMPVRRSMGEQISGTAQFLERHSPQALHRAALRALDETAHQCVRRYAALSVSERARALAGLTALPESSLAHALHPDAQVRPQQLGTLVQLLETARRRLRNNRAGPPHEPRPSEGNANADTT